MSETSSVVDPMQRETRGRARWVLLLLAGPVLAMATVWIPLLSHQYVSGGTPPEAEVMALMQLPADARLREVEATRREILDPFPGDKAAVVRMAQAIVGSEFQSSDLYGGLPSKQLSVNSLAVPDLLIESFETTSDPLQIEQAARWLLAFARYERGELIAKGFLRNDHAIAARVSVLTRFWRIVRNRPLLSVPEKAEILLLVRRTGQYLARNSHFTFATNHGVMQNVALLQLAAAFPNMPERDEWRRVAIRRLTAQFAFYVSDEGVTLEHSAGYHHVGVALLASVIQLVRMDGGAVPDGWHAKYVNALRFLRCLRRADGTLPAFGDTAADKIIGEAELRDLEAIAGPAGSGTEPCYAAGRLLRIYPVSGYALVRAATEETPNGVFLWSNFRGQGHKLDDDLSFLMRARGEDWITNTGYWPYGVWGREQAESWDGSNAPHMQNEPARSLRMSGLQSYADSPSFAFLDGTRSGPADYRVERQVLSVPDEFWMVLDWTHGAPAPSTTIWTSMPGVQSQKIGGRQSFRLDSARSKHSVWAEFAGGDANSRSDAVSGRKAPFAGWVALGHEPRQAPSVVVLQPKGSWAAASWTLSDKASAQPAPMRVDVTSEKAWQVRLATSGGEWRIAREGAKISVVKPGGAEQAATLTDVDVAKVSAERKRITEAFDAAAREYGRFRELTPYRVKVSLAILAAALVQMLFFGLLLLVRPNAWRAMSGVTMLGWVGGALFLHLFYFQ